MKLEWKDIKDSAGDNMVALIIGGSGSGKSEFAEKLAARISDGHEKYYIATMEIFDEESEKKAERHRMAISS